MAESDEPDPDEGEGVVPDESDEEQPEIAEDEKADFDVDPEMADQVESESGRSDESDEEEDEDEDADELPDVAGDSWGDKYVALVALALAGVVREYGELEEPEDEDESPLQAKAEEIMDLATFGPLDLARDMDRLLAKHGGPTDVPPEVSVALGTIALAATVIVTDTDMAEQFLEGDHGE